ncbi:MAG TPA: exonuclease domain-containing protein [Gemmatimonadaceae bacterium]|nr:exonuclease domain-containing protein [Gemmatimonadaceae bacterium]
MTSGIRLRPAEMLLIARARDFLAAGPSDAVDLIAHVCQLPGPPRSVAVHMAMALLAPFDDFAHDGNGGWRLVGDVAVDIGGHIDSPADSSGVAAARQAPRRGTKRGTPDDLLADLSYVVVDVETTGGRSFGADRITEIAAVVVERGEITRVYESLVNPQRPIPPMVSSLTNITWKMVKNAPTFRDIVGDVADAIRGHVFVAHNAGFDWRFVTTEIHRATGERMEGRRLCTVKMARRLVPQLSRRSLDHLSRFYDIENSARHRAGGDALATAKVFLRLLREARERGCATWFELEQLLVIPSRGRRRRRRAMPHYIDRDTTA